MLYQQGDVLIETISHIPKGLQVLKHNVLAEGEATGHAHRGVIPKKVALALAEKPKEEVGNIKLFEDNSGTLYLSVGVDEMEVVHEEHDVITIPGGTKDVPAAYKVRKVREYDHFQEEARPVRD